MRSHIKSLVRGKNKLLAGISVAFLISLFTFNIRNADAFNGGGSGTTGDPYLISTCMQLQSIGDGEDTEDRLYKLSGDIDCSETSGWNSGAGFAPLPEFKGTLDGQGHTITGLTINRPSEQEVGLFTRLQDAALVTRLNLASASITGGNDTGAIAGQTSYASMLDVQVSGTVATSASSAGGLVGSAFGWSDDSIFERVGFTGSVSSASYAGGIIGQGYNGFTISDVYVDATINSDIAGGVIGRGFQSCGYRYINRALVKGALNGSSFAGGFTGRYENISCYTNEINHSVSLATLSGAGNGAAVGSLSSSVVTFDNIYFDQTTAGTSNCVYDGTGDSGTCSDIGSSVAPSGEPYAQWDFADVWEEDSGNITQLRPIATLSGPDAVSELSVTQGDPNNSVGISWAAPSSLGTYPLLRYRVEIKEASASWANLTDSSGDSSTSLNFQGLKLGTEYDVRVAAVTEYSMSDWVYTSYATPEPEVYTASTCEELDELDQQGTYLDTYLLGSDIDCSGYEGFTPLHWNSSFRGVFDGQGHTVSNLDMTFVENNYYYGLFAESDGAEIRNINFEDGSIVSTDNYSECGAVAGDMFNTTLTDIRVVNYEIHCTGNVGGLVGYYERYNPNEITLSGLYTGGIITSEGKVGGLFGYLETYDVGKLAIKESYSDATVSSESFGAGGLVGAVTVDNEDDTAVPASFLIQDSYSAGEVSGISNVGGMIGSAEAYNDGYDAVAEIEIENSYSSATVSASDSSAGGIIGYMDDLQDEGEQVVLNNVFAAGSVSADNLGYALIGSSDGISDGQLTINNSYFDQTLTGQTEASDYDLGGTAVNTDGNSGNYFKNNITNDPLDQWNFSDIWETKFNDYPILRISHNNDDLNGDSIPDVQQPNIGGYTSSASGKTIAIDVGENCELTTDDTVTEDSLENQDANYDYGSGLWEWEADCTTPSTTVKLYYYDVEASGALARKFNPVTKVYSDLPGAVITQETINGHTVTVVTYSITDNGELDFNPDEGTIQDPVGLARSTSQSPSKLAGTGQSTTVLILMASTLLLISLLITMAPVNKESRRSN